MGAEMLPELSSFGIAGLLFVMWWAERQERARTSAGLREALQYAGQIAEVNKNLLDVIRANTEALAALREELRSHRTTEAEWLSRVARRLDDLET